MKRRISASVLAADFWQLGAELEQVKNVDLLHLDVMDGNFVPNISYGPPVIERIKQGSEVPLDIHLMIERPERYLADYAAFQPEFITIHYEAVHHLQRALGQIRELGVKAGVALNPHTPLEGLRYVLDDLDLVLIMTVNPGFGGQKFIPAMREKVRQCHRLLGDRPIELQVDGGVTVERVRDLAPLGANNFVAGSAIFRSSDPRAYIEQMREA